MTESEVKEFVSTEKPARVTLKNGEIMFVCLTGQFSATLGVNTPFRPYNVSFFHVDEQNYAETGNAKQVGETDFISLGSIEKIEFI